tara:strand:- start:62 stop:340 length:279 start_codon:yes stop_codon:yes gene_type:complete
MERLRSLLNKYGHIYDEEEAIEVTFRHRMRNRKVPKDIGYNEKQNREYLNIYEELDSGNITESEALDRLTMLMEEYYGIEDIFKSQSKFSLQ